LRISAAAAKGLSVREEEDMRSHLMILPVTLELENRKLPTYALTDSGAEGKGFVDQSWAESHELPLKKLKRPFPLEVFDGRESESGLVTHYITASLRIEDHFEKEVKLYVTQLAYYPVILGMPWLKEHDPRVGFASHTFTFDSEYCQKNCNTPARPSKIRALHDVPKRARPSYLPPRPPGLEYIDIAEVSLRACSAYIRRNCQVFLITIEDIE
jgi:hypothetical protein